MAKRTPEEIQAELAKLKEIAPKIRPKSAFGDSNTHAVKAQIQVLEENMSLDDIYDLESCHFWGQHTVSAATDTRAWMDGDEETSPTEGWEGLVEG